MNLATKAALYNALLFPGWGHLYLKEYKRGIIFILPVGAGMLSICWAIIQVAIRITKANPFKKGTIDITTVFRISIDSVKALYEQGVATPCSILLIPLLIILLWILSVIDAYGLGKKQMRKCHS